MEKLNTIIERTRAQFEEWLMPTVAVAILFLLFFVAGGGVSHNGRWRIDNIEITGANTVSTDAIEGLVKEKLLGNYFFVYARENSYLYPQREIEEAILEKFPRIASAHASRVDSHNIILTVIERKPYALWCGENVYATSGLVSCWFIDTNGFVFDRAPQFSSGVYMQVYGKLDKKNADDPTQGVLPRDRFYVTDVFSQMVRADIGEPLSIAMKDEGETELTIHSSLRYPFLAGVTLRFNGGDTPATLVKNLLAAIPVQFPDNVALKKKLLYIDMRFGNKIFFGFEN